VAIFVSFPGEESFIFKLYRGIGQDRENQMGLSREGRRKKPESGKGQLSIPLVEEAAKGSMRRKDGGQQVPEENVVLHSGMGAHRGEGINPEKFEQEWKPGMEHKVSLPLTEFRRGVQLPGMMEDVVADDPDNLFPAGSGHAEAGKNGRRYFRTSFGMPMRSDMSIVTSFGRFRFADIVQEGNPKQNWRAGLGAMRQRQLGMAGDIALGMVLPWLRSSSQPSEFGNIGAQLLPPSAVALAHTGFAAVDDIHGNFVSCSGFCRLSAMISKLCSSRLQATTIRCQLVGMISWV